MSVATPKGTTVRKLTRSWGVWVLVGLATIGILSQVFGFQRDYLPLDPRSSKPDGTGAAVEVLQQQGVDVELVFSVEDMPALDENTTLLVTDTIDLDFEVWDELPTLVDDAGRVVFANMASLKEMGIDSETHLNYQGVNVPARSSTCGEVFGSATAISSGYQIFIVDNPEIPPPPLSCFKVADGYAVGVWPETADRAEYVWSPNAFFQNDQLLMHDNGAAALTLLGNNDRLVWFYPTNESSLLDRTTMGIWGLLPRWTYSTALLLLFVALAFMFFRGRRFGPLAYERLPVAVKSSETVIQHGHLVHETRDAAWAISALQVQAQRKIRKALLLPDGIDEGTFVTTVASRVDRSEREIHDLLFAPYTGGENQIVQRAKELDDLVEEVVHV
jgi:hypothetical protein